MDNLITDKPQSIIRSLRHSSTGVLSVNTTNDTATSTIDKSDALNNQFQSIFTKEDCSNLPTLMLFLAFYYFDQFTHKIYATNPNFNRGNCETPERTRTTESTRSRMYYSNNLKNMSRTGCATSTNDLPEIFGYR